MKHLEDKPPNARKSILSALVVVTNNDEYRKLMLQDVADYNKEIKKQEKTPEQEENWLQPEELNNMFEQLKKSANLIYKKDKLTNQDLQVLQNFLLVSLFKLIPPRRAKDYTEFKIKNISKDSDNYIDKNQLVFNTYKTAKTYGQQRVEMPKELKTILNKWIKVNPTEYLLFDTNMNKLTNVKLNQRFNKIFGGKKSVNALRHSFLTDKYADDMKKKKEMEETMKEMGSSVSQLTGYVKLD
jgi:integrase